MIKKFKDCIIGIVALVALFVLVGVVPETAFAATTVSDSCYVGDTGTCILSNPSGVKVNWTVSNNKIKVIKKNKYGLKFKAKSAGTVKVVAKSNSQKVSWKITIKKRNLQTVSVGSFEYGVGINNACVIPNATGATVTWNVSNSNISVVDKNNYALRFLTVAVGTTKVTATVGDYKYQWTITVVDDSMSASGDYNFNIGGEIDFSDILDDTPVSGGYLTLTEADLEYYTDVMTNYVLGLHRTDITETGLYNFVDKVIYYVITSDSFPTEEEVISYMKIVDYCLFE